MNRYPLGTTIDLTATITDKNGALFDPNLATVRVKSIDGLVSLEAPALRVSEGVFTYPYTPPQAGFYVWTIFDTGNTGFAAQERQFEVLPSSFS